jgi:tetratricopeptide (TPR) repeat protein
LLLHTENWSDSEQIAFALGMLEVFDCVGEANRELWKKVLARRPNDIDTWLAFARAFPDAKSDYAPVLDQLDPDWAREWKTGNAFDVQVAKMVKMLESKEEAAVAKRLAQLARDPRWTGEPLRRVIRKCNRLEIVKLAQPIIASQPGGLGWLAEQYQRLGDHEAAINLAKAAINGYATIDDWLRLEMLNQGNIRQADFKSGNLPEAQDAALAAANMIRLGRVPERDARRSSWDRAYLQAALAIYQARFDRAAAIGELEDYLGGALKPADRAWATRTLAMLLAIRGEVSDREKAAKLLTGPALDEAGATLADRRATAAALAGLHRHLDGDTRANALTKAIALTEACAKESNDPKDAFVLCRLYKSAGRTQDAVNRLNELLKADPGNLDYLLAGLDVLVEAKQYDAARGFADRLLQLGAGEYRVVAAVARFEAVAGQPAKALMLAESYFRSADPLAGDVPAKTLRTAELHADLARLLLTTDKAQAMPFVEAAVAKYESLLPGRAEVLVKMAALLAAADRSPEALAKIGKLRRGLPMRVVAAAGVTAIGEDASPTVLAWIREAQAEDAKATRAIVAEYALKTGDVETAKNVYREILGDDSHDAAALNNLAWLLAADPATAPEALAHIARAATEAGLTGELLDTRARVKLAMGDAAGAIADASEALRYEKTALRFFHLALATQSLKPEESTKYFAEAMKLGLTEKHVHPMDRAAFRLLSKAK